LIPTPITSPDGVVADVGPSEMEEPDGFTKNETIYFIHLMREHFQENYNDLPTSIAQLQERINLGKRKKKLLWQALALKMTIHFEKRFQPEKLQRKWKGLQNSFKKLRPTMKCRGELRVGSCILLK